MEERSSISSLKIYIQNQVKIQFQKLNAIAIVIAEIKFINFWVVYYSSKVFGTTRYMKGELKILYDLNVMYQNMDGLLFSIHSTVLCLYLEFSFFIFEKVGNYS